MIRRHIFMSAAAATALLSSCGGGNDDPSPTPTPSPTTSPTPTPTASPTYAALPLAATAAAEFLTINATTSYTGDLAGDTAITLGVAGTEMRSDRVRLATSGAIGTATTNYVIRDAAEESRFVPADLTTPAAAANPEFVFRKVSTASGAEAGNFTHLNFLNNVITGSVSSDALIASLKQVSYGLWYRGDSTAGAKRVTTTIFGYPTVITDMPKTGTIVYNTRVAGRLVASETGANAVTDVTGTASVSVNYSTGLVSLSFTLDGLPAFTAQGALPAAQNQFTGSIVSGTELSGTVAGGFFGSAASEVGLTFAASGLVDGANVRLVGVVIGRLAPPV